MEALLVTLSSNLFGIEGLEFANPTGLWLLFLWPLLWVLSGVNQVFGGVQNDDLTQLQSQRQLVVKHALIHKMQSVGSTKRVLKWRFSVLKMGLNLLRGVIIMSLAIALAQPEKIQALAPLPQQKTVRDIVFVIESSASFLLPDYQVDGHPETRMNVVKNVLDQFISGLEGNRFGLAIYAEQAYTLMPLTADQTAARLNLKRLKPYLAGRTDGAMGEALGLALKQTSRTPQKTRTKQTETDTLKRVVVLISDGLSQPSRLALSEAINYAQLLQVPIYTIGVGTNSQAADKRLYTGLLYQPLESDSLKAIASETQGQYFEIGSGQDLNRVLQKINEAEGVPYETPPRPPRHIALYDLPLSISVISLLCYLFLSLLLANKLRSSSDNQAVH
ncbi:vWA domain-containing protein [Thiomicrorhabdus arctica]|uniref:vWA domain-containing protein n=1 Tax=Thiomicrorhabdus arctica TaxID=131540 RepID=UPI000378B2B3|nr:VWA domain-containing protein [Thiomicrorhabdus arctica]